MISSSLAHKLDAVLLGKAFRASSDEVHVRALGQHFLGGANGVADVLHATHPSGAQGCAVHDECVQLHPAVHVEKRATAGIERLIFFHRDDGGLNCVKAAATPLQHLPA